MNNGLDSILDLYRNGIISMQQVLSIIHNDKTCLLLNELNIRTAFLDEYKDNNITVLERLYYIINNIGSPVLCKYCGKLAKWTGRISKGYLKTCCSDECKKKEKSENYKKQDIEDVRIHVLKKWENTIVSEEMLDDNIILENIKYEKYLTVIENPIILSYLNCRFDDSDNITESYQRIKYGIEKKPLCEYCHSEFVHWIGKPNNLMTRFCSNSCARKAMHHNNLNIDMIYKILSKLSGKQIYRNYDICGFVFDYALKFYNTRQNKKTWLLLDVVRQHEITDKYDYFNNNRDYIYFDVIDFNNYEVNYAYIKTIIDFVIYDQIYDMDITDKVTDEFDYYKSLYIDSEDLDFIKCRNYHYIIKYFQYNNFYMNELDIILYNPEKRLKLIQNRIHYLEKHESELTINDLLRGFKISGIHYGYSHFNPEWTNWFITKFDIKSVYDPCGGWGHHMLGMLSCDRIIYNDISKSTCEGVQKIKDYFSIEQLEIHNNDGAEYIPEKFVDAWFMCPPYYNIEHYDCGDFESMEDYQKFLNNIFRIWDEASSASIFGMVIREDFYFLLDDSYKRMCSEQYPLNVNKSHLQQKTGKKFNEYFYIFKKNEK